MAAIANLDGYSIREEQIVATCAACLALVPSEIIRSNGNVIFRKMCPLHGEQDTIISRDAAYYDSSQRAASKSSDRAMYKAGVPFNCSTDCSFSCVGHRSDIAAVIVELLDACNMTCPTCVAGSSPMAGNIKSLEEIHQILEWVNSLRPMPPAIMLSGGEPTIHPEFEAILDLVNTYKFPHVFLITNGVRIAENKDFTHKLKRIENLEVYLQFDSLDNGVLENLRGSALSEIRKQAISNLSESRIPMTLVCITKKSVNDHEIADTIKYALKNENIRGVTFQPLRFMGRTLGSNPNDHSITLDQVRTAVIESGICSPEGLRPHPSSPETICVGYIRRSDGRIVTKRVNALITKQSSIVTPLYCLPSANQPGLKYDDLFRITIVSYLDAFSFSEAAAQRSIIAFAAGGNRMIPLDTYYLFYKAKDAVPDIVQIN